MEPLNQTSLMLAEAREGARVVQAQYEAHQAGLELLCETLRQQNITRVATIARGSSDHAADFFGYLMMAKTGRWVTSLPMSLITLERAPMQCAGLLSVAFSQSGASPDLVEPTRVFSANGATTVAFVNNIDSSLAHAAQWPINLHAGVEKSVAATKSFIAQLFAGIHLIARWQQDQRLLGALKALPEVLEQAANTSWLSVVERLSVANRLLILGRGAGLAIAKEAALKLKETCAIQAEAFSGAEVKHGPMALIEQGYPVLVFAPRGPAQAGLIATAKEMRARGALVILAATRDCKPDLEIIPAQVHDLDAISLVQSFYPMVEALARAKGLNPDQPNHLSKVTLTN
jgi:glutamine---fructose-6-phosphate transaminase (isomerizing)